MALLLLRLSILLQLILCPVSVLADKVSTPVTIGIVANNEPYSSYGPNGLQGFSIDLLDELSRVSGVEFDYRVGSWSEIYAAFLRGDLDAVDEISWRQDRVGKMLFTKPYHLRTTVIMHDASRPLAPVKALQDLRGHRVGVLRDIYYSDLLKDAGLSVTEYDFQSDLVRALSFGWVDAVVGPELTLSYMARQQGFVNLKVLASAPLQGQEVEDFRIAVGPDRIELYQQLEQGLARIDPEWIENQRQRWQEYGGRQLQPRAFSLSPAERAIIRHQGPLRVGLMRDHAPLTFEEGGKVQGLSVDILHRISDLTGLQAVPVVDQWSRLLELLQRGEIDMVASMSKHPERLAYARFTQPYFRMPVLIFAREPGLRLDSTEDLAGQQLGIGKNIYYASEIRSRLGENTQEFSDQASMFRALDKGQLNFVLASLPQANHWIRKFSLKNVHVAGELKLEGLESEDLRFGMRPELSPLIPIIDKALSAITLTEKRTIENRWLGAHFLTPEPPADRVEFNSQEQIWLAQHRQTLRYCIEPAWMPLSGVDLAGQPQGIAASLIKLLEGRSGIRFEHHPAAQAEVAMAQGRCDFIPLEVRAPDARPRNYFTDAYYTLPTIILGRLEAPFITSLEELTDKPLGIRRDFALFQRLKTQYPGLNLVPVESETEGIRRVQQGRLYGYIGTLATSSHQLRELGYADVRVLGRVPMDTELSLASFGDDPVLEGILDKLVASLTNEDILGLDSQWRSVELHQQVDYTLLWQLVLAASAVLALMYFWVRKLRRLNQKLEDVNRQLEAVSSTDALTGLGNRVYFEQHFEASFNACLRSQTPFMVAVLDVDFFKRVNDSYGHPAGDRCLEALANMLKSHFRRDSDYLVRFGGEEFVIFCPVAEPHVQVQQLENLRAAVEAMSVETEGVRLSFTVSIGYTLKTPTRGNTSQEWLREADQCVYHVKSHGRNQVYGEGRSLPQVRKLKPAQAAKLLEVE